jgi:hypothetical protein
LHQVWQPAPVDVAEDALSDQGEGQQGSAPSAPRLLADDASLDGDPSPAATRVTLRPHDPATGEEIDKREVVKGYEYARGEFVSFTAEELKALDVESSKVIDLEKFAPRNGRASERARRVSAGWLGRPTGSDLQQVNKSRVERARSRSSRATINTSPRRAGRSGGEDAPGLSGRPVLPECPVRIPRTSPADSKMISPGDTSTIE